jgi:Tfp pilus assembly protein PilF
LRSGKKPFGKRGSLCGVALALLAATLLRAELQEWVQHLPAGPWLAVFFRTVALPAGSIDIRRPPAETRPALTGLIAGNPKEAALYRLRAQEAELQLDFRAAAPDWRMYVELAKDRGEAELQLADYYDRRHLPQDEVNALLAAGRARSDRFAPVPAQRSWQAFTRAVNVATEQALPDSTTIQIYRAWMERYPGEPSVCAALISFLSEHKLWDLAGEQIAAYEKTFPGDGIFPIKARAELARQRGSAADALALYERAFQPLWPDELIQDCFKLLADSGRLRAMVARARGTLDQAPADTSATALLFYYWRQQNNAAAARRVLEEYRLGKESRREAWTAEQLFTLARLFEKLPDANEAARLYYALYSLPGAEPHYPEDALGGLAGLLLANAGQPIRFGSGDLSLYKDIATLDPAPGFLNGILSLILNSTQPRWRYREQDSAALAYFHRAAAAELIARLDSGFPQSESRPQLHAKLIDAYAAYGDNDAVIRAGRAFLTSFPRADGRVDVALQMADALAREQREREEFATYDQLLRELARRAEGVPLGQSAAQPGPRSPDYARVLERYLSRLAATNRPMDAIRLYRREIDRNPNDAGLYERFAAFLDQNHLAGDIEAIYRQAIARFPDRSWYDKLARWYLRSERTADFDKLTHEVTSIFSGSELEAYFGQVVASESLDPALYQQLNLYAHERFPDDLVFVRNLLVCYQRKETYDTTAWTKLMRAYWFYDGQLRDQFFESLARAGQLDAELEAVRAMSPDAKANPAAAQLLAEGEAWRSHFEEAAPVLKTVAESFPGDRSLTGRASALYRSLATMDARHTATAVALAEMELRSDPRDRDTLAKIGDIYADRGADRGRFAEARRVWNRMPATTPGSLQGWLDAATVFWDYYLYDDALRLINDARARFGNPALFAFEAGAIWEGKRDDARAVEQYIAGYLSGESRSERRILRLAKRPALRALIDRLTIAAADPADAPLKAVSLRIEVLEQQQRRDELEHFLLAKLGASTAPEILTSIEETASDQGFADIQQRAIERQIAVTGDPVEQMRLRLALMRFFEAQNNVAAAAHTVDALWHERPLILGVVRAAVDFHVRNKQPDAAVGILRDAAAHAQPEYRDRFTLEVAGVATDAGHYEQARELLKTLLAADPYRTEYLSAQAGTWLRSGDDKAFRDFQLATIRALKQSPLTPAERTARIATLRRALIPALTRLRDFAAAVDQYIEVVDSYPEDESLIREASLYAASHQIGSRMVEFYRNTIQTSPRDYRWPMVLAHVETALEDYPAAISAYDAALKARPDRADLLAERARLEERLLDFDRAIRSCLTLYELSYHNGQWMRKVAELNAKLGRHEEAVTALKTAVVGQRTATAADLFQIAQSLDAWNYTADAASFVERGAALAGPAFAQATEFRNQAAVWARILTRARKLETVLKAAPRKDDHPMVQEAGKAITAYYTAEEKAEVARQVMARAQAEPGALDHVLIPLAESAGLAPLEADLLAGRLTTADLATSPEQRLVSLQMDRAQFGELAGQLDVWAARVAAKEEVWQRVLREEETARRAAGDAGGERSVLDRLNERGAIGDLFERYLDVLAAADRERILALARKSGNRDSAAQLAIRTEDFTFARRAIVARGAGLPPVWTKAYTALAGVYAGTRSPEVSEAFAAALGGGTIGERIQHRVDRDRQLAGGIWYYYGARYGEYLAEDRSAEADAWLPATVEAAPADAGAYFALGTWYEGAGGDARAIAEYEDALQLDANRGDAHNAIARILWREGRHDDAVARWKQALAAFDRSQNRGVALEPSFWTDASETIRQIGSDKALPALRGDIEKLLRGYATVNDGYNIEPLLKAAFEACRDAGVDYEWVLDIADDTGATDTFRALEREFTPTERERIQRWHVATAFRQMQAANGTDRTWKEQAWRWARLALVDLLIEQGKLAEARAEWASIPVKPDESRTQTELRLAAATGTLEEILARYRGEPDKAPARDVLERAAVILKTDQRGDAADSVLEFLYDRELASEHFEPANFLGLAEVWLDRNETGRAVALLRRMTLIVDEPFDSYVPAATLLAERGKQAEAVPFLRDRVKAVPWDDDARLQLARLLQGQEKAQLLSAVVQDGQAEYGTRAAAARLLGDDAPDANADPNSELGLLRRGRIAIAEAARPFYIAARLAVADRLTDPQQRFELLRDALAIDPADLPLRIGTIRAAIAAGHDSIGEAAFERIQNGDYFIQGYVPRGGLTAPERASLASLLSAAYERAGNLTEALKLAGFAVDLESTPARKSKCDALQKETERRKQDVAREPQIHKGLEQDRIVRPRRPS